MNKNAIYFILLYYLIYLSCIYGHFEVKSRVR